MKHAARDSNFNLQRNQTAMWARFQITLLLAIQCYTTTALAVDCPNVPFILHRHVDHPGEGGLNLGLRRRASDGRLLGTRKSIYGVFGMADQSDWRQSFEFALPIVGLKNWP